MSDVEIAKTLGVDSSTLNTYLSSKRLINAEAFVRALIDLGISLTYRQKEISARPAMEVQGQISFIFDKPCAFEETNDQIQVAIDRKQPASERLTVQVRRTG